MTQEQRVTFTGADYEFLVNGVKVDFIESLTWSVSTDMHYQVIVGSIVASLYEKDPLEYICFAPGEEPLLKDYKTFDLAVIAKVPGYTRTVELRNIRITQYTEGVSENDISGNIGYSFTASSVTPWKAAKLEEESFIPVMPTFHLNGFLAPIALDGVHYRADLNCVLGVLKSDNDLNDLCKDWVSLGFFLDGQRIDLRSSILPVVEDSLLYGSNGKPKTYLYQFSSAEKDRLPKKYRNDSCRYNPVVYGYTNQEVASGT